MITITMQEVLKAAIDQLEVLTDRSGEPMAESTKITIKMLTDAVNSRPSLENVELDETSYSKPVVTKQELVTRLYNLTNQIEVALMQFPDFAIVFAPGTGLLTTYTEARETLSKIIK